MKTTEKHMNYAEWYQHHTVIAGGLITPAIAAKILSKTRGRIAQMIAEGKLKAYIYENETPLISYAKIMELKAAQEKK